MNFFTLLKGWLTVAQLPQDILDKLADAESKKLIAEDKDHDHDTTVTALALATSAESAAKQASLDAHKEGMDAANVALAALKAHFGV